MMILRTAVTRNVVATSVVYLASVYSDEKRTQTDITKAAGVTDVTLRNRNRDLK